MQYLLTQEEHDALKKGLDVRYKELRKDLFDKLQVVCSKYNLHQSELYANPRLERFMQEVASTLRDFESKEPTNPSPHSPPDAASNQSTKR